ncbi:hypothetical protein BGW39_006888 [Mortierella sp. 14UC]|nr:hypothetical protein BGW39_006888 [Mortierella sp. 14UC]
MKAFTLIIATVAIAVLSVAHAAPTVAAGAAPGVANVNPSMADPQTQGGGVDVPGGVLSSMPSIGTLAKRDPVKRKPGLLAGLLDNLLGKPRRRNPNGNAPPPPPPKAPHPDSPLEPTEP